MHLGVMAQGLVVAHALHRVGDCFPVQHPAAVDLHLHAEAPGDEAFQDLRLDLPHEAHVDLLQPLVPGDAQQGVFLLQRAQPGQHGLAVHAVGQRYPVGHHRLQPGRLSGALGAQALAVLRGGEAGHGAHASGGHCLRRSESGPGIEPDLIHLLTAAVIDHGVLYAQCAAGDLQIRQPVALAVVADLEHPCAEVGGVRPGQHELLQIRQEFVHALQLQPGAEPAGEELPGGHGLSHLRCRQRAGGQIGLHQFLPAHGRLLGKIGTGCVGAVGAQLPAQVMKQLGPAVAGEVHLGHEQHRGHGVVLQQPPQRAGVGLYAVDAADDQDGVVQHLEHPLRFTGEVHVAGGVQQRHVPRPQRQVGLAGEDGDAPLPLQLVGVHGGVAAVHPPGPAQQPGAI